MLKKVVVVYDDTITVDKLVKNITGPKSFGSTIYKRKTLKKRVAEILKKNNFVTDIIEYDQKHNIEKLLEDLQEIPADSGVVHLYANFGIRNEEGAQIVLEKARFVNRCTVVKEENKIAAVLFPTAEQYIKCLKEQPPLQGELCFDKLKDYDIIQSDAFVDLGELPHFMQFITGGFDARFFNALEGDEYTVTKRSSNRKKIKSEYTFYSLLPEQMKMWFVMPFAYHEEEDFASYTMERYHMTDIAIRWIHQAINLEEFDDILKRLFRFVSTRDQKTVSREEYDRTEHMLYIQKVEERMEELKKSPYYARFNSFIVSGTNYRDIDAIVERYKGLYDKLSGKTRPDPVLVIGHGDLCFSNILYNKETSMLKLIDPKGALKESELWTNPYYDVAKLSHSICGRYDFFNSALYDIRIEADMKLELELEFDNTEYTELFREYLTRFGFDYTLVRLYEASLFLSMLPLHIDNPQKVFGFLLNGIHILDEVEQCIQD